MRQNNSIRNEYENLIDSNDVAFDSNDRWNQQAVPVIGMEGMVPRARLRYTRSYLTPGICSLIKHAVMEKLMPFSAEIPTVVL